MSAGGDASAAPATTVAELVAALADDDGLGVACGDERWSWRDVVARSERVAAWLSERRGPGPFHVGVLLDNTPEYLVTLLGSALAGATVVGLNATRRGEELARDVRHTDCVVVVTNAEGDALLAGLDLGGAPVATVGPEWPAAGDAGPGRAGPQRAVSPSDLFVLVFTSGSTGAPKAVRMTHRRAAATAASATWLGRDDVLYSAMPLFHGNALNAIVLPALASGATIALRPRFSASEFMPDVRRHGATFFSTVGRALAYVLATPESPHDRDHRVRFALAPESSPADLRAFRARFGIRCFGGYGSSENAITMSPVPGMRADALGAPPEGLDVTIVDPETLEECPEARLDDGGRLLNASEAIGEIVGRNVVDRFEGYYNNPEADAARTRNGWYWSGDLGYRTSDGVFFFAGRSGDWLRVDSENFAAAPVERVLARYPAVRGAVVYAVPDARTADDQVMAALELAEGEAFDPEGFAAFLAAQPDLGTKWAPRYVRLTTLPVTGTNKVDKKPLRAQGWRTADPMWWRPGRTSAYRPFTNRDRTELEADFRAHGRSPERA